MSSEEYINTKVRPILELLLDNLLDITPEDPIPFMYTWLLKYNNQISKERLELEELREKMKEIKEKDQLESANSFLTNINNNNNNISPEKEDPENYYSSESEEEENLTLNKIEERRQKLVKKGQRSGISAEAFGRFNKKKTFQLRVIEKTDSQKEHIKNKCLTCFLFNNFDDVEIAAIVDACEEKRFKKNKKRICDKTR